VIALGAARARAGEGLMIGLAQTRAAAAAPLPVPPELVTAGRFRLTGSRSGAPATRRSRSRRSAAGAASGRHRIAGCRVPSAHLIPTIVCASAPPEAASPGLGGERNGGRASRGALLSEFRRCSARLRLACTRVATADAVERPRVVRAHNLGCYSASGCLPVVGLRPAEAGRRLVAEAKACTRLAERFAPGQLWGELWRSS
jgi:hypothetical protein